MEIIYRQFNSQDAENIKNLTVELVKYLSTLNPNRLSESKPAFKDQYYNSLLEKVKTDQATFFVAEANHKLVGYIYGELEVQSESELLEFKPLKEGFIPDLFVKEEFRGLGVGSKLLVMIETWFKSKGYESAGLSVLSNNLPVHKTYLKHGYKDYFQTMSKKL